MQAASRKSEQGGQVYVQDLIWNTTPKITKARSLILGRIPLGTNLTGQMLTSEDF